MARVSTARGWMARSWPAFGVWRAAESGAACVPPERGARRARNGIDLSGASVEYRRVRVVHEHGIHLTDLGLALDPTRPARVAVLSHGHGDHACAAHGEVIATRVTAEIYLRRVPGAGASRLRVVDYGEPTVLTSGATVVLEPAGHILGSAQTLVTAPDGERLVYSGDFKLKTAIAAEPARPIPCDHLVVESTYGKPGFRTVDALAASQAIQTAVERAFAVGAVPIFAGYPLGRGQELVHALLIAGYEVAADPAIARFFDLYKGAGYATRCAPLDGTPPRRVAVVAPMHIARTMTRRLGHRAQLAYVSGWACDPALAWERGASCATHLIPYSDHADHAELRQYVAAAAPRVVDVIHGYTEELAYDLRCQGINARAVHHRRGRRPQRLVPELRAG
jgi:Cft2 family RNA processing exonuclease